MAIGFILEYDQGYASWNTYCVKTLETAFGSHDANIPWDDGNIYHLLSLRFGCSSPPFAMLRAQAQYGVMEALAPVKLNISVCRNAILLTLLTTHIYV